MLVLFLRALVAPLYLLAANVLALCATLGLTVAVFQGLLGQDGLTFYVPFAAAVLLVSLGSDYNIFAVGHIWQLASRRPLRQAMAVAIPQSTRAITSAGIALAASFGLLALVPLVAFRELAFALAVGILLDVLVVRTFLVPSLLTLVGPVSGWPSRRLRRRRHVTRAGV
jgi:RND superfamily putative drug exporter